MSNGNQPRITIHDFLTSEEIDKAWKLYHELRDTGRFAVTVKVQLIEPNIKRINQKLGQENDPMYLAYAVEGILNQYYRDQRPQ